MTVLLPPGVPDFIRTIANRIDRQGWDGIVVGRPGGGFVIMLDPRPVTPRILDSIAKTPDDLLEEARAERLRSLGIPAFPS